LIAFHPGFLLIALILLGVFGLPLAAVVAIVLAVRGRPSAGTVQAQPLFSPDGDWWWDGQQWRSALSSDGRWRWNGVAWEPTPQSSGSTNAD
jgi:hypothetical protein